MKSNLLSWLFLVVVIGANGYTYDCLDELFPYIYG